MRSVLLDVNVVLDVLLERDEHVEASAAIWELIETGKVRGFLAAHAITTIHYLVRKHVGTESRATKIIGSLLAIFRVATVDQAVIEQAIQLSAPNFEDAVTAAAAHRAHCEVIVTRDLKGFQKSPVPAVTPEAAVHLIETW